MAEDNMFQEAVEAAKRGERERARDLFTRLLRSDQSNPAYWLWMSSLVDSSKERAFCLQNVLRIEPEDSSARLGLILIGAINGDESRALEPPFRRKWVTPEEVRLPKAKSEPSSSMRRRRTALLILSILLVSSFLFIGLFGNPFKVKGLFAAGHFTVTPRVGTPRPTATLLPTKTPLVMTPKATFAGPTPLWMILEATYTPTPLYVNTPHPVSEAYRAGLRAYQRGELLTMQKFMEQAAQEEPDSPDTHYYLGEAHRLLNEYEAALADYEKAIQVDERFAPAYLSRARVHKLLDPGVNSSADLDQAVKLDANFNEAYLERANFYLTIQDYEAALKDLEVAEQGLPGSPLVHLYRAQAYLETGQIEQGLAEAKTAYSLDRTLLPGYLILGKALLLGGEPAEARPYLEIYTEFQKNDAEAWLFLGRANSEVGNRSSEAIKAFDRAMELKEDWFEAYLFRGLMFLELKAAQPAVNDLFYARNLNRDSFQASLGLGRALLMSERYVEAVAQISNSQDLTLDEKQLAEVYYWRAQAQDALGAKFAALKDWQALLDLPSAAVPPAWAKQAERWLIALTPTPTNTATVTPSKTATRTATPIKPSQTPTSLPSTPTPSPSPILPINETIY
jgi:tetratricopeptide (TPR) repeat protein